MLISLFLTSAISTNCFAYNSFAIIPGLGKNYICHYQASNGIDGFAAMAFTYEQGIKPSTQGKFRAIMELSLTSPFVTNFEKERTQGDSSIQKTINGENLYSITSLVSSSSQTIENAEENVLAVYLGPSLESFSSVFGNNDTVMKLKLNNISSNGFSGQVTLRKTYVSAEVVEQVAISASCKLNQSEE